MKTSPIFRFTLRMTMLLTLMIVISSCQKTEKMQTFNDVFDTSGIETLNNYFKTGQSLADLPIELGKADFAVPQGIRNITPAEIAEWYNQSISLSDTEIDLLLKNDSRTYIDVINRMSGLPTGIGTISADDFKNLKSGALNKYLLKTFDEPENFYSTDYYSAIIALQDYIKMAIIEPMEILAGDPPVITIPPGSGEYPDPPVYVLYYKAIALNNIWDMWWAYWSDGTRTKHKGSAGSFPG